MSNSNSLHLGQPLTLNKLYVYSNSHYSYFTPYYPLMLWYFLWFTPTSGLKPSFSWCDICFLKNTFLNISDFHHQSFLFFKQSLSRTFKLTTLPKLNTLFKATQFLKTSKFHIKPFHYTLHSSFFWYKTYFNSTAIPISSPFIKKNSRVHPFLSKLFSKKSLKTQRLKKKIFQYRKFWFLYTILKLNKKLALYNIQNKFDLSKFLKTLKLKRNQVFKRKTHLMPRQNLFLNGTKLTLKNNKSLKIILLRRIIRFYRRKFRKINLNTFNNHVQNKNLKYKFKLLKLKKRTTQFLLSTLSDTKFNTPILYMNRVIRRGNSRLKLRRTKKYYLQYFSAIQSYLPSKTYIPLLRYYRISRSRYLNRFFRQNIRRYKLHHLLNFVNHKALPADFITTNFFNDHYTNYSASVDYYHSNDFINVAHNWLDYSKNLTLTLMNLKKNFSQKFTAIFSHQLKPISFNNSLKPISVVSKYKTSFIFSSIGFIFLQNVYTQPSAHIKAHLNKFRYSFLFKKELKRYLLKKPGKLKLITSSTLFTNYKNKYNRFGKPFINSYFSQKLNHFSDNTTSLFMNNILTSQTPFFSYKNSRKYSHYLGSFFKKEVRIKRIKFKPGYSRIWREARDTINTSLNLHSRYQYRLTRHLHRIQNLSKQTQSYLHDLTLKNTLINSRFVNDVSTAVMFVANGLIFVNGNQTSNPNLNLFQNDFIQIIVNLKFYIIFKWLLNWNASKRIRLRKLSKTKFKKFKMMVNKQRSRNLPDWILTSRLKSFDIPKYLEVDFFTLSTFILYEPFILNDLNSLHILESRSEILNMYNWKYIN